MGVGWRKAKGECTFGKVMERERDGVKRWIARLIVHTNVSLINGHDNTVSLTCWVDNLGIVV